jgi:hypothetical protein
MKCVTNNNMEFKRVSNEQAKELVKQGWRYYSKAEYKFHKISAQVLELSPSVITVNNC